MFRTETHLHTKESSTCGWLFAEQLVKAYHEAGYSTICICDHLKQSYFDSWGDIPWQDKIAKSLRGYYCAVKAAKEYGINVLLSAEIEFKKTEPNHYLVYGITEEFLNSHLELCKISIEEFSKIAKGNNIFVVQAHPFRDGTNFPTPDFVDAMEIYNSNPRHQDFSKKSLTVAKENGLYISAGSDTHREEDIARSGIITENEITTAAELIQAIKSGKIQTIGA